MGLENLVRLPQPPFEHGDKTPFSVARRKALAAASPRLVNLNYAPFSGDYSHYPEALSFLENESDEFMKPAYQLLQKNLYIFPDGPALRAGGYKLYGDSWLRDSFYGTLFLEDLPDFQQDLLSRFGNEKDGQVPTTRLLGGNRTWAFDDESTMLAFLWSAKIALNHDGQGFVNPNDRLSLHQRWNWIHRHADDTNGYYRSPAGTERSWFDTYQLKEPDVLTYNQGIYAVAALAAAKLGIEKEPGVVKAAIEGYKRLAEPFDSLRFSKNTYHRDASALMGEFLALHLFEEPLLPDKVVQQTVEDLPKTEYGYKIVTREDGRYLDPSEFNRPYRGGEYQNGDDWFMFSAVAKATAELHGMPHSQAWWLLHFIGLNKTNHAESAKAQGKADHLWNTTSYEAARLVSSESELKALPNLAVPEKVTALKP